MKRSCISILLCLALCLAVLPAGASAAFTDISDGETAVAAAVLQGLGVVDGTSATTFRPDRTVSRAEVCAMVVRAAGLSSQVSTYARRTMFSDVAPAAWYNGYVNLAYTQGYVNGNGDGTFSPEDPVTYGELATILLRLLGYTSAEVGSIWPLDYTGFCDDLELSEGLNLGAYDHVTRGETAVLLYRTLCAQVNGSDTPYYSDSGAVAYVYLSGGTASTSEAAVATAASAASLARSLGLSGSYAITKNGGAAASGDVAAGDVGYYDAASGTLRVSDYRISGYLTDASPSVTAAETVTVAGCTLEVLECAWDTLGQLELGERVTLLLTDDCKVAAAYPYREVQAEMVGVLTNSDGTTDKFLCTRSIRSGSFAAVALGRYSSQYERAGDVRTLTELDGASAGDFYQQDGEWYVETDGQIFRVADGVQVYYESTELWDSGADALATVLADGLTLTLYADRDADEGGQIRIVSAG